MPQSDKPRIALAIHALYGGGAERLMSQLATRWSTNNALHLITWAGVETDAYPIPAEVERHGLGLQAPSHGLLGGLRANLKRVRKLRQTLRAIRPEMLLSFSDQMNIVALEAVRGLQLPTWIAEHSDPAQQKLGRMWEAWRRRSYPTATGCVALTPAIAAYVEQWIPADRLRVIPPAIDPPEVGTDPGWKPRLQVTDPGWKPRLRGPATMEQTGGRAKRLLFIGRLSPEKGVDLLLRAWKEIEPQLPDWELHIAGDGGERKRLEELAAETRRVHFLGWVASPWQSLAAADLFVLPSRYEGFPVALLEAMSQGMACVVSRCSSAIDTLNAGGGALCVVDRESVPQLAAALQGLAQSAEARAELGRRGAGVADAYRWENIGPLWDQLLALR